MSGRSTRFVVILCVLLGVALSAQPCRAYAWMVSHEYTGCAVCHADPSGGGLLSTYGRAQQQTLLATFGRGLEGNEVDHRSDFMMGALPLPEWFLAGGSVREMAMSTKASISPRDSRIVHMQADARVAVVGERFVASASAGFSHQGGRAASLTRREQDNVVAREFWAGYRLGEDQGVLLRAGRIALPFGIRTIEHTLYVRNDTGTNLDDQQEWGVALAGGGDASRWEVMGIIGNFQVRPDAYRRRGYSAFGETVLGSGATLGLSSLLAYVDTDPELRTTSALTGAHGPFLRWSPRAGLVLLSEVDLVHTVPGEGEGGVGGAGVAQLDYEPVRGLHGATTSELYLAPVLGTQALDFRQWLTVVWFVYAHVDLRADAVWGSESFGGQRVTSTTLLGQVHVSL